MDPNSRYIVTQSRMAERRAEADRARMAKGDPFAEGAGVTVHGRATASPSLLGRLIGLRLHTGGTRTAAAPSAMPAG
jgi:hypothetical protein